MPRAHIGSSKGKNLSYELNTLTRHAAVLGTTGSGKTVMCKVLVEEALAKGIPVIAIDPKGDIGTLGVVDKAFDFRPFAKDAAKVAAQYVRSGVDTANISKLAATKTTIYTPKSNAGVQVSLLPDLSAPVKFDPVDPDMATFVDTVSESVLQLAGIKRNDKAQSLVSTLLIDAWNAKKNLTIKKLIGLVQQPPFEEVGSLPLEAFMKTAERAKLAASLNVLLTSPSKRVWSEGDSLDPGKMLKKGSLSVFDLRFAGSQDEKQFVVEQVLQELYRYLMRKGGSERLKFVLYIDELAGLLPPPPSSPPCKRMLELLIRQARAFGLGIIVATQNPGDIDYKVLGNMGTRFIGRLRTENDIDKVASAMDLPPSTLKTEIAQLSTGKFVYNDAVRNTMRVMQARWLLSYHRGPLSPKEIEWINDPKTRPKKGVALKKSKIATPKAKPVPKRRATVSAREIVKGTGFRKKAKKGKPLPKKTDPVLKELIRQVKKYADKVQLKSVPSNADLFVPHLRIVVEAQKMKGVPLEMQGPWLFDLTARMIPEGDYLKGRTWSQFVEKDVAVVAPKRSVVKAFDYAVKEAKRDLRTLYFESTVTKARSTDRDDVEKLNLEHMKLVATHNITLLVKDLKRITDKYHRVIAANERKRAGFRRKLLANKTANALKKLAKKKTHISAQVVRWHERMQDLADENKHISKHLREQKAFVKQRSRKIKDEAVRKAENAIAVRRYRPARDDLIVHATILLVPARTSLI